MYWGGSGLSLTTQVRFRLFPSSRKMLGPPRISVIGSVKRLLITVPGQMSKSSKQRSISIKTTWSWCVIETDHSYSCTMLTSLTGNIKEHVVTHWWRGANLTLVQAAILGLKIGFRKKIYFIEKYIASIWSKKGFFLLLVQKKMWRCQCFDGLEQESLYSFLLDTHQENNLNIAP